MTLYAGLSFFEALSLFFYRTFLLFSGQLSLGELAADEIQIYTLSLTAFSAALVGSFLVLKRMTMLANALSHTILLGIVGIALFLPATYHAGGFSFSISSMMIAAVAIGLLTTFLTQILTRIFTLQEDAAIGLVFTSLFALAIVAVTLYTRSLHIGTEVVMGNVDALHLDDLRLSFWVFILNALFVFFLFKEFQITTFDPLLAKGFGISLLVFDYLLMVMTSLTTICGFRAVGVLMVLAFITAPPLTARLFTSSLRGMLLLSLLIGALGSLIGTLFARHLLSLYDLPLSTGGLVTLTLGLLFFFSLFFKRRN